MALQVGSLGGTCLWLVGAEPRGPSLIPGQEGPCTHLLSPTIPFSMGSSCSRHFTTCLPPKFLDASLPGDKPHPERHNMVYSHHAFQPWCGAAEGCCKVLPTQLPHDSSYLLSLFSLFPSLSMPFGGCWAGSTTGMLWGNYTSRVPAGCCSGECRGTGKGGCLSVCPTPVLTPSCICRDQSVLLCTHRASLGMC